MELFHLKSQGKREQSKKASGRGAVQGENCLLCDKNHSTQSCRFLRKCRKLLVDKFKTSKEETAAVAEESEDSTEDDICFMVHEDLTGTSSTSDILDIPDLVEDSDSEDDEFQMNGDHSSDRPYLPGDIYFKDDIMDYYIESKHIQDNFALTAKKNIHTYSHCRHRSLP